MRQHLVVTAVLAAFSFLSLSSLPVSAAYAADNSSPFASSASSDMPKTDKKADKADKADKTASSDALNTAMPDAGLNQQLATTAREGSAVLSAANNAPGNAPGTAAPLALATPTDKISYAMGVEIGVSFKSQNLDLNTAAIAQGINDGLTGSKTLMGPKEIQATLEDFQKTLMAKRQTQIVQMADTNKRNGEAFLAANKTKPGVVTLPDGLQYKIIKPGEGVAPQDHDLVTVNYTGTFTDGRVFDSSYAKGKPVTFPVNEVIAGWSEVLKLMKTGAVWEVYVPSSLAYGQQGNGPIGPNQTLVFKIELISVSPAGSAVGTAEVNAGKSAGKTAAQTVNKPQAAASAKG